MKLEGSCACGGVTFTCETQHPYPFNRCYCSICRKTAGGGGFAINLGGEAKGFEVSGVENTAIFRARMANEETGAMESSPAERHFCKICASALWVWDPRWPELIHPFASAIDSELPLPPQRTHLMLGSKKAWVEPDFRESDKQFEAYPDESIAEWHRRLNLEG